MSLRLAPGLLFIAGATLFTVVATGVVSAATQQLVRVIGVCDVACVSMAVTSAPPTYTYVFHRVEVLQKQLLEVTCALRG